MSKDEVKEQLLSSLVDSEKFESTNLDEMVNPKKSKDAIAIIREYEESTQKKMKKVICIPYQQGNMFKRLKEKEKFTKTVKQFKINQSTIQDKRT